MKTALRRIYFGLILFLMYAPIVTLVILSFNASKSRTKWGGFTLSWYVSLFQDEAIMSALYNTLVIALIATYIFGLGTFAGTVAIAVFTFAYCGKILYEQIETADMGSHEALEALGMGRISAIRYAIWPQVLPQFISTVLFCFEGNVRYASILGYVGAGGLGLILNERIGWMEYARVGMILLALFVTVVIIESISSYLRSKLA